MGGYSSLCQIFARKATQPGQELGKRRDGDTLIASRTLSEFSVPLLPECHQGALHTAGEFSDDVLMLSRGDFLRWHSRIASGAQRLGRESRDNLSNTYTA